MSFLLAVLISLGFAFLCSEILKKIGLPRMSGQIIAGIILVSSPIYSFLFTSDISNSFGSIADIGVILLFFFIGLELNLRALKSKAKEALLISVFNTFIPLAIGLGLGILLGYGFIVGIIIGISFAVSSQSVTFDWLEEFKLLKTRIGSTIIAAGAIDDIIEFIVISFILTSIQLLQQTALIAVFLNLFFFLAIIIVFKFFLIPRLLVIFEGEKLPGALFTGAVFITLLMAVLSDALGLSSLLGALIAGILVRQVLLGDHHRPWEEHSLSKTLHTLSFGFFIPIFSVWIGINTDLSSVLRNPSLSVLLLLLSIIATNLGSIIGVLLSRGDIKEGLLIGMGVSPKGDVELVVALLALRNNLITKDIFSSLIFMAVAGTIISGFLFHYLANKWRSKLK